MAVDIIKAATDDRSYRLIVLNNGLEALLVSDPTTEKAAAALDVGVGSLSDPDELPGLAHFLEHLLFMGTGKYPDEADYMKYVSEHAGLSNAFTASDHTNYHFEVASDALHGGLDRFAQFFIEPLFSKSCQERELLAVDSEHKKNLQSDVWRITQLERSLSNPSHPWHRFSTGNRVTLGEIPASQGVDVRQRIIDFYHRYYSAGIMKLAVIGAENLDTLEDWVRSIFAAIPGEPAKSPPTFDNPPILSSNELGKLIKTKPVMDVKQLQIEFLVPDQQGKIETQPSHHYSHLIGHESSGSLFHFLKEAGLATDLMCGNIHICSGQDKFEVSIELTNKGFDLWEEVLVAFFEYIDVIKKAGPQEWVFNELKTMTQADFDYHQKIKPMSLASNRASTLHRRIPRNRILNFGVLSRYDRDELIEFGKYLTRDNTRVFLISQSLRDLDRSEKWYGTEYSISPLDFATIEKALTKKEGCSKGLAELRLPDRNNFIPDSFDIFMKHDKHRAEWPNLIVNEPKHSGLMVWHKPDDTFMLPKAVAYLKLLTPHVSESAESFMLAELMAAAITDSLTSCTYYAHAAGLQYAMGCTQDGLKIEVMGYNDKLPKLVNTIVNEIMTYDFGTLRRRFDLLKERILRILENSRYAAPYTQLMVNSNFLLAENVYSLSEKITALESTSVTQLIDFIKKLWTSGFGVELLCVGNLSSSTVIDLARGVRKQLGAKFLTVPRVRSFVLPEGMNVYWEQKLADKANVNNAIYYIVQFGSTSDIRRRAALGILSQIIHQPCFNQLRTTEQLGYIVGSSRQSIRQTLYLCLYVQSEESAAYVESRIEHFLSEIIRPILENISDGDWVRAVNSVIHHNLERPKNMFEEATVFWNAINTRDYDFDRRKQIAALAADISKEELLDIFNAHVDPKSPNRAKFSLHLKAQSRSHSQHEETAPCGTRIEDPINFRKSLRLADIGTPKDLSVYEVDDAKL